jgi:O-acetylserine/cysteine efflux transporter
MRIRDILLALTTMLLWGLNFAVAKLALAEFPPILLSALRFTLVALILLPFVPRPKRIRPIIELAVTLGLLQFPMVFFGLTRLDASTASIVLQLQVPLGVVMAAILLGEKLSWRHGLGMAIAFAGVALIAGAPRLEANRIGLIFLLIAATAWGFSTVQLKKLGPIDPFVLNGWLGLFVAIELTVLSLAIEGSPLGPIAAATWRGWSGLLYTGLISTIVAFGLWAKLVARYSVSQTLPFMLTVPLFAIVGGIVLNGDRMTADIIAGGLLTLAGVGLIVVRWPRGRRLQMAVPEPS